MCADFVFCTDSLLPVMDKHNRGFSEKLITPKLQMFSVGKGSDIRESPLNVSKYRLHLRQP
jgi:hypothetical protein